MAERDRRARLLAWFWRWRPHIGVGLICLVIFRVCRTMQESGHGWGDDFALYIDQARALSDGSIADVISLTRFALDNSAYNSFSAYVYPWFFPILLAPIVAFKGLDYSALKLVGTLSFVVALFVMQRVFRHRIGEIGALVIMLAIGFNNVYIGYTDAVLSDLTFLMMVFITLWWLDRVVDRGKLFGVAWRPLLVVGILASLAFNTRREGSALLLGIAFAQLANWRAGRDLWRRTTTRPWRRLALTTAMPYLGFALGALVIQAVLPGQPYPRYDAAGGSGLHNMVDNLKWYKLPLAEALGLKDIGPNPLRMFGSTSLAETVLSVFLVMVLVGILWRLLSASRIDAHLIGTLLGLAAVVLSPPFHENRYLLTVLPLMLYFAWQGVSAVVLAVVTIVRRGARGGPSRVPSIVATIALAVPVIAVATDTKIAYDYHRVYTYVEWGPESPAAQEAFAAVLQYTDARDVIVFYQSRTMNLYTRRKAIQGNSESMMLQRGDWYLMVKDSDYIQTNLTDERAAELGFVKMWENSRFVLWRIPPRYPTLPASGGVPPEPATDPATATG